MSVCPSATQQNATITSATHRNAKISSVTHRNAKISSVTHRNANPALCITVDCNAAKIGNGIFSAYGTSTKYYALCTAAAGPPPVTTIKIFQCATGAVFDKTPSVSKCVYTCTAAGKFVYSLDIKKYYNCVRGTDGKLTATLVSCPNSSVFIPADRDCGFAAVTVLNAKISK